MTRLRPSLSRFTLTLALVVATVPVAHVAAAEAASQQPAADTVSGVIRDGLGHAVARALILLSPVGSEGRVRTFTTGEDGRFSFAGVPDGRYRLTAIREGYESAVSRIATWTERSIDLVLAPAGDPQPRPAGPGWILAAPKKDILRERGAAASAGTTGGAAPGVASGEAADLAGAGGVGGPGSLSAPPPSAPPSDAPKPLDGAAARTWSDPAASSVDASAIRMPALQGEVQQSFSGAGSGLSPNAASSGIGSQTSLALGTPIGPEGRWGVKGEKDRENLAWDGSDVEERQVNAERVGVNVELGTGGAGRIDMRAYYDHLAMAYDLNADLAPVFPTAAGERRVWGYDAAWSGKVWDDASLDLDLRYFAGEADAQAAPAERGAAGRGLTSDDAPIAQASLLLTSAHFSKGFGDHHVDLAMAAGSYSFDGARGFMVAPVAEQDPSLFTQFGQAGWTVSMTAGESWSLGAPVSFVYGVDLSRTSFEGGDERLSLVPQAGVTLTLGPSTTLRGLGSFTAMVRDVRDPELASAAPAHESSQEGQVGYRVQLDQKLGDKVLVVIGAESRPFYYGSVGAPWRQTPVETAVRRLYLSDADASLQEIGMMVEGAPAGWGSWEVGAASGRVTGQVVATVPDYDLMTRAAAGSEVRYETAHAAGRVAKTGTAVAVDLTRVSQSSGDPGKVPDYHDSRAALSVLQDVGFIHPGNTDWAVQVSYTSYRPGAVETTAPAARRDSDPGLRTEINRLSGGVSVRF